MKYKKTVLPNGMRILTVPLKESQTAIGMVLVETGSDHESKELNGLSHFLEHMCFKGTTNRTGNQIKLEVDGMGAESNAFTSNEFTGYYAKASKEKIHKVIDLVSDMYLNPIFPVQDIEIERGVIIEEINMYDELPQRIVGRMWQEMLYPNTSAGRRVIGSKENILKFSQEDFISYYKKHYIPAKTVVVVAGNIDEKAVIKQVKNIFALVPNTKISKRPNTKFAQAKPNLSIQYRKSDQSHLIIGFRSFDMYKEKNYALKVASIILGKGFSSRLFTKLRDELGLCYYVSAGVDAYTDRGNFIVRSGVTNARALEAVEVIISEFKKLRDEEILEKELKKAKDFLIGNFAIGLETSEDVADYFGFQEIFKEEIMYPRDYIKKIKAVTVKDIQKVLKEIMKDKNLNLALIGPFKKDSEQKFKKVLKV